MLLVLRKRPSLKEGGDTLPSRWSVHRFQALGDWLSRALAAQFQNLPSFEQGFDRPAEPRPEFHLARDGALHYLARQTGVQDQAIGELYGLTHDCTVAYCYQDIKPVSRVSCLLKERLRSPTHRFD